MARRVFNFTENADAIIHSVSVQLLGGDLQTRRHFGPKIAYFRFTLWVVN
jgi:hypothetical protein